MPRGPLELPNRIRHSQASTSSTPPNLISANGKGETTHFATKVTEPYERNVSNSSLRNLGTKRNED